jgi:phenylalanyl-tRNA synthetase beta subunit
LVPKEYTKGLSLKLKNPLGGDTEYLRTSLMPSLVSAANENKGTFSQYHLFEVSNVYVPRKMDLPEERLMLAGIFEGYDFRTAKGVVEGLFEKLNIKPIFEIQENDGLSAGKSISISVNGNSLGMIGYIENTEMIYYELTMQKLIENIQNLNIKKYQKFPPAEDIIFNFPDKPESVCY